MRRCDDYFSINRYISSKTRISSQNTKATSKNEDRDEVKVENTVLVTKTADGKICGRFFAVRRSCFNASLYHYIIDAVWLCDFWYVFVRQLKMVIYISKLCARHISVFCACALFRKCNQISNAQKLKKKQNWPETFSFSPQNYQL